MLNEMTVRARRLLKRVGANLRRAFGPGRGQPVARWWPFQVFANVKKQQYNDQPLRPCHAAGELGIAIIAPPCRLETLEF
jgi:hypothetical protein